MSRLLKCSMKQEVTPPYSLYSLCTSLAFCLQYASLSGQTPAHPRTPSSNVTFFKRIPCVPVVSYIYILPLFLHIIFTVYRSASPKGRSFVFFTFPPPTLSTMPVTEFFHSKWLRADCVEPTNLSFDSTLPLFNCRTLDKAVNSKR